MAIAIGKTPLSIGVKGDVTHVWDHDHWISRKIQPLIGSGEELTTKHGMVGTNVLIDASMTGSALKITSFGWKTSMP